VDEKLLVIQEVKKKDIAVEFGVRPSTLSTIKKYQDLLKNGSLNDCTRSRKRVKQLCITLSYYLLPFDKLNCFGFPLDIEIRFICNLCHFDDNIRIAIFQQTFLIYFFYI
jgi:hypothetical protein